MYTKHILNKYIKDRMGLVVEMNLATVIMVGLVIFSASVMESITGFGSGIIALPFLGVLIGIKTAVPMITVISIMFTIYMLITNYKKIAWKEYFTIIGFAIIGMPFGMFAFSAFNEATLKLILGIFVILCAFRALLRIKYPKQIKNSRLNNVFQRLVLFSGGIIQGAFSTGGPLIVVYSADKLKDKSVFRATMSNVWLTLNTVLIIKNVIIGNIMTKQVFTYVAAAFPFFIAGTIIGLYLHSKVSIKVFSLLINIVLLAAGVSTLLWAIFH
jgi:uncharacterized protein